MSMVLNRLYLHRVRRGSGVETHCFIYYTPHAVTEGEEAFRPSNSNCYSPVIPYFTDLACRLTFRERYMHAGCEGLPISKWTSFTDWSTLKSSILTGVVTCFRSESHQVRKNYQLCKQHGVPNQTMDRQRVHFRPCIILRVLDLGVERRTGWNNRVPAKLPRGTMGGFFAECAARPAS
ncbi:hypothetical protein WA026_005060 [Henosepilachna vigintioctopunctata]|uniref:Uncharacterized protein n=1 Tax=Henosepilachna vigintioctopunctata TaxID=420089 RepID=A0AAW1UUF1_9CUCU